MLGEIYLWVYSLSWFEAAVLVLAATGCFVLLRETFDGAVWWKTGLVLALAAFAGVILWGTVLQREPGNASELYLVPFHSYREVMAGGSREILRSNWMNVLLFYPAGLLGASVLPKRWRPLWRVLAAALALTLLSAGIEGVQFAYGLGRVEIDDVLHNSLGALLGSLAAEGSRMRP